MMKKYYKIKEIADLYGIGVDSLRYYEKVGLIQPKRSSSNYRLYSLSDIWVLNVIRDCLKLGYDTKQIKDYLEHRTVNATLQFLKEEQWRIENQIKALRKQYDNIQARSIGVTKALSLPCNEFQIVHFETRNCRYLKERIEDDETVDYLLTKLSENMSQDISVIGNLDSGSIIEIKQEIPVYTSVFIVDKEKDCSDFILEEGDYCIYTYRGAYDRSNQLFFDMKAYLDKEGYKCNDIFFEFLLIDVHETNDESEYITQVQTRVTKKKS